MSEGSVPPTVKVRCLFRNTNNTLTCGIGESTRWGLFENRLWEDQGNYSFFVIDQIIALFSRFLYVKRPETVIE
jgi:hypothetical protein